MKVTKIEKTFFPFKDHYKKSEKKKDVQQKKKEIVDQSKHSKEDNSIKWA